MATTTTWDKLDRSKVWDTIKAGNSNLITIHDMAQNKILACDSLTIDQINYYMGFAQAFFVLATVRTS